MMKSCLPLMVLFLLFLPGVSRTGASKEPTKDRWISLFNGKNLDGWKVKITGHELHDNYKQTFRVEDGLLKVSYDQYDKFEGEFGHLFYKDQFSHYKLRVEYQLVGKQIVGGPAWGLLNSGVMLHSQSPESMTKDQRFPVSLEAQFLADDGSGKRTTGNVCSPGTHIVRGGKLITEHCTPSSAKAPPVNQWVTMEVEVRGNASIKHVVNGQVVLEYEQPQLDEAEPEARRLISRGDKMLDHGYLALQAESHPIVFRKVEILILDAKAKAQ